MEKETKKQGSQVPGPPPNLWEAAGLRLKSRLAPKPAIFGPKIYRLRAQNKNKRHKAIYNVKTDLNK